MGVCFEEQHIDTSNMSGELLTAVFAAMSQKESENISAHMRWSYRRRMQSGQFITCKAPFGYCLKEDGKLVINEREAEIVRMIFDRYLAGQSKDDIAEYISMLGVPTREGNLHWKHKAISYILSNERYAGDSLLQKKYTTDTLPFKQKINCGEKEQYFVSKSHPAIIDRETFEAVAALLSKRTFAMMQRERSPLAMRVFCETCGNSFRRAICGRKTYWVCRQHFRGKNNCPSGRIPEEEIHAAFLRVYHKLRLHGEPILKQMITDLQSIRERRMLWSLDIVELNKRIADLSDQDRMLADMNKCGLVDPDILISQNNELARQIRASKQEKERLLADGDTS